MTRRLKSIFKRFTKKHLVFVCVVLLLSAQVASLEHEIEHEHHEHEISCDAFIAYSSSGAAVSSIELPSLASGRCVFVGLPFTPVVLQSLLTSNSIRAPPA